MNDRPLASASDATRSDLPAVGVIGLGQWGRNLIRNMAALGAARAMCDPDPSTRATLAAQYREVPALAEPEAIFADPAIEAVMIATPAVTHGALVRAALAAGKHVFVEKPMCLDIAEAEELANLAVRANRLLMVGHLLLYHPAFTSLQASIAAGQLGRLRYIYSNRASLGRIRRDENALWSFAPHDVSMILALAGALPERVIATGGAFLSTGIADTTLSHLTFAGGLQAHIFVSWLHPFKDHRLVVVGERAMAAFDDTAQGPGKLLLYRHQAEWSGAVPVVNKAAAEPIPYDEVEPLRRECSVFLAAVRGRAKPPSDAAEGIRVLRVLNACQAALESGMPVRLDP
jgi:UDP-2-acetamido-3-amino-2,3-dideoxy-glucuronate N-acetyltransferase